MIFKANLMEYPPPAEGQQVLPQEAGRLPLTDSSVHISCGKPSGSRTSVRPSQKPGGNPQNGCRFTNIALCSQGSEVAELQDRRCLHLSDCVPTWPGPPAARLLPNPYPGAGRDAKTTCEFREKTQDELQGKKLLASHQVWK